MTRKRKDLPCSRCLGVEITWLNADDYRFCDHHMAEIFRELHSEMRAKPNAPSTRALQ